MKILDGLLKVLLRIAAVLLVIAGITFIVTNVNKWHHPKPSLATSNTPQAASPGPDNYFIQCWATSTSMKDTSPRNVGEGRTMNIALAIPIIAVVCVVGLIVYLRLYIWWKRRENRKDFR
jgi:flagellar basal body-associated protein FliL